MRTCKVEACKEKSYVKQLCTKHYQRLLAHGDETFTLTNMHGLTNHRVYSVYAEMIKRCYSKNRSSYKHYGGRGITVCARWCGESGPANFISDMFPTFIEGLELDRQDNNGNYEPSNCRWVARTVQQNNKRTNVEHGTYGRYQSCTEGDKGKPCEPCRLSMNAYVNYRYRVKQWRLKPHNVFEVISSTEVQPC